MLLSASTITPVNHQLPEFVLGGGANPKMLFSYMFSRVELLKLVTKFSPASKLSVEEPVILSTNIDPTSELEAWINEPSLFNIVPPMYEIGGRTDSM